MVAGSWNMPQLISIEFSVVFRKVNSYVYRKIMLLLEQSDMSLVLLLIFDIHNHFHKFFLSSLMLANMMYSFVPNCKGGGGEYSSSFDYYKGMI